MRSIGVGLAIAIVLSAFAPATALAASAKASAASVTISKEQRDKGKAAAPGLIQAAGLDCQLADARQIGESTDPKTKVKSIFYELACSGNEGLVVDSTSDSAPPKVFTCLESSAPTPEGKPNSLACILPGNADPKAALAPYIAKSGKACAPDQVRALGHSATNTIFELACHGGGGYILRTSAPPRLDKDIQMDPCVMFDPNGTVKCELTDRASQLAIVDQLAAQSGKSCTVKDKAFIGVASSGDLYYEVACQDGKGYVLEQAKTGALTRAIDCANADFLNGGCKLTDARQAKTEQAGLYTQLAKKAGFDCNVSGYAPFSVNLAGKEVVELACSNRPDGGIGIFSSKPGDPSVVLDCAHSELKSFRCGLTKAPAGYPALTADLKALGKASCQVSASRMVGVTADQRGYMEVGCADGLQGYMIEYSLTPIAAKAVIICSDAKGIAGGCTLPGNTKKG
ncbi:MAG TPA: hypothetical protein VFC47_00920 [Caulobacteraceae bacterium]|nr:hypothetical protein [Caulobacteraceae bacterium]